VGTVSGLCFRLIPNSLFFCSRKAELGVDERRRPPAVAESTSQAAEGKFRLELQVGRKANSYGLFHISDEVQSLSLHKLTTAGQQLDWMYHARPTGLWQGILDDMAA
jgi:hypothetical protein